MSDEGAQVERYADVFNFIGDGVTATGAGGTATINIPGGDTFDLHDDVGTARGTLNSGDRLLVSAENINDDPNRYTTLGQLAEALADGTSITSSAGVLSAVGGGGGSDGVLDGGSYTGGTLTLERSVGADVTVTGLTEPFDLHDDVTRSITAMAANDRLLISDEGTAGDPNVWINFRNLLNSLRGITSSNNATPQGVDRLFITDESESGDPVEYITIDALRTAIGGSGAADGVVDGGSVAGTTLTLTRTVGADIAITGLPGNALLILDENVTLHPTATSLDFAGAGVTCEITFATGVTCTIPGGGGGDDFAIHDLPQQTQQLATTDRIPLSDESASGDPNEYLTAFNFFSAIRDVVNTNRVVPLDNDRMYVTREDASGDPLGYITVAQLQTRIGGGGGTTLSIAGLPNQASTGLADTDIMVIENVSESNVQRHLTMGSLSAFLADGVTITSAGGKLTAVGGGGTADGVVDGGSYTAGTLTLTRTVGADIAIPGLPAPFNLHDDVTTFNSFPARSDRLLVNDESLSGDPNEYVTMSSLLSSFRDIINLEAYHNAVPQDADRLFISDESASADPVEYITVGELRTAIGGGGGGDADGVVSAGSLALGTGAVTLTRTEGLADVTFTATGTLPLSRGGTGATSAGAARTALGVNDACVDIGYAGSILTCTQADGGTDTVTIAGGGGADGVVDGVSFSGGTLTLERSIGANLTQNNIPFSGVSNQAGALADGDRWLMFRTSPLGIRYRTTTQMRADFGGDADGVIDGGTYADGSLTISRTVGTDVTITGLGDPFDTASLLPEFFFANDDRVLIRNAEGTTGYQTFLTFKTEVSPQLRDEGTETAAAFEALNFTGAGVTCSQSGLVGTCDIPGGDNGGDDAYVWATEGNDATLIPDLKIPPEIARDTEIYTNALADARISPWARNVGASGTAPTARLGTGTANTGTFLRGDRTWANPSTGGTTTVEAGLGIDVDVSGDTYTVNQDIHALTALPEIADADTLAIYDLSGTTIRKVRADELETEIRIHKGLFSNAPAYSQGSVVETGSGEDKLFWIAATSISAGQPEPTLGDPHNWWLLATPNHFRQNLDHTTTHNFLEGDWFRVDNRVFIATATLTGVTGDDLLGGHANVVELTSAETLAIANGGTGATTAGGARTNLGTNNASNLTSGTVAAARIPASIARDTELFSDADVDARVLNRLGNAPTTGASFGDYVLVRDDTNSGAVRRTRIGDIRSYAVDSWAQPGNSADVPDSKIPAGITRDSENVAASRLTGTIATARIPNLNASKITAGSFSTARIPNLSATKITSGTISTARLGSGTASSSTYLRGDRTWAVVAAGTSFDIHDDVTTGATIVDADRIPFSDEGSAGDPMRYTTAANLADYMQSEIRISASVITSGTLTEARLPTDARNAYTGSSISGNTITFTEVDGGTENLSINLPGAAITSGTLADARIPAGITRDSENVAASRLTGTISVARIPSSIARDSEAALSTDVRNIVSMSRADYDALTTKVSTTLYLLTQ